jgi:NADH dehydrogenase
VVFGSKSILLNNIAWLLRRLPVFGVPGSGEYRLQPVAVEDVADLAVRSAAFEENVTLDAAGPDTYTFNELVRLMSQAVGSNSRVMHLSPAMAYAAGQAISAKVGDVVITRDEIDGLMANLLVSHAPPTGQRRFTDWLDQNAKTLGLDYMSEVERHYQ